MKTMIQKTVFAAGLAVAAASFVGCDRPHEADDRLTSERSAGEVVDDNTITRRVKDALESDSVKYPDIQVSVYRGVVQLSGFVDTEEQKSRAGDIAQRVPGVTEVKNEITLKDRTRP